jgi:hypothetical protein
MAASDWNPRDEAGNIIWNTSAAAEEIVVELLFTVIAATFTILIRIFCDLSLTLCTTVVLYTVVLQY